MTDPSTTDAVLANWTIVLAVATIVLAIATVVLAVATVALAVAACRALGSIKEAKRARNALAMSDLSRRWDEPSLREVRRKVQDHADSGPDGLLDTVLRLRHRNDPEYRELLTEPSYLEDIAIAVYNHGIDIDIVLDSLGYIVYDRWRVWEPVIEKLRELRKQPTSFENFEKLAIDVKDRLGLSEADWEGPTL